MMVPTTATMKLIVRITHKSNDWGGGGGGGGGEETVGERRGGGGGGGGAWRLLNFAGQLHV